MRLYQRSQNNIIQDDPDDVLQQKLTRRRKLQRRQELKIGHAEATGANNPAIQIDKPPETITNTYLVPQPPAPPAPPSSFDLYRQNVLTGLTQEDPRITSARNVEQARQGGREYAARLSAREAAAKMNWQPGTAQASRLRTEAMSPALAAGAEGQRVINEAQRGYFQNAMDRAMNLKTYDDSRADVAWTHANTERVQDETSAWNFINGIKDPKARQYLMSQMTAGGLPAVRAGMQEIIDGTGTIGEMYRSQTPAQNEVEYYSGMIQNMGPEYYANGKLTALGQQTLSKYLQGSVEAGFGPLDQSIEDRTTKELSNERISDWLSGKDVKLNSYDWTNITPEQRTQAMTIRQPDGYPLIVDVETTKAPGWDDAEWVNETEDVREEYLKANPWATVGRIVTYNGELYEITGSGQVEADRKGGRRRKRITIEARPVGGGAPIPIAKSNTYFPL